MTSREIVGENIRELRKIRGYSIDSFAESFGFHNSYIGAIERGQKNLTLDTLDRLAAAFNVPVQTLMVEGAYKAPAERRGKASAPISSKSKGAKRQSDAKNKQGLKR